MLVVATVFSLSRGTGTGSRRKQVRNRYPLFSQIPDLAQLAHFPAFRETERKRNRGTEERREREEREGRRKENRNKQVFREKQLPFDFRSVSSPS